jgi:hypothetical protein
LNPKNRLTVQEALNHAFIKEVFFDFKELCQSSGKESSNGLRATIADTKSEK